MFFCQGWQIRGRLNCFKVLNYYYFKVLKKEVILQICHCIYSHKFLTIPLMISENTNLSKIILFKTFLVLLGLLLFVVIRGCKDITKFICHVTLFINHLYVKFDSDRPRESEFITFFICHVTLCDQVINRLCDLMNNKSALKSTTQFW